MSYDSSESGPERVDVVADLATLQQEIQLRAYYCYCERGCAPGADVDDWLAAEREVLAQRSTSVAAPGNPRLDDSVVGLAGGAANRGEPGLRRS